MIHFGTTTLPLAGWLADPRQPEASRTQRLAAIRQIAQGYRLPVVELTMDLALIFPQIFEATFYGSVANLQQELGFACTAHLPFLWVDLASLNEPVRQASLDSVRRTIELIQPLEVQTYVLHLWGSTTTLIATQIQHPAQRQGILGVLMAQAGRSLGELCQMVTPRNLCVENLEDSLFDLAVPLVEEHGTGICLDVGHLAWHAGEPLGFLARHGDRVREVHLHDVTGSLGAGREPIRDHQALGQGHIDYNAILRRLLEIDYRGAVILEVNSQADLETSLERVKPFLDEAK